MGFHPAKCCRDPDGLGPAIAHSPWSKSDMLLFCIFVFYMDPDVLMSGTFALTTLKWVSREFYFHVFPF